MSIILIFAFIMVCSNQLPAQCLPAQEKTRARIEKLLKVGESSEALKILKSQEGKKLSEADFLSLRLQALAMENRPIEAFADLKNLMLLRPNDIGLIRKRAHLHMMLNEYPEALKDTNTVLARKDKIKDAGYRGWVLLERAVVYKAMKKPDLALKDCLAASDVEECKFQALRDACTLSGAMGKHAVAVDCATKLIKQLPSDGTYYIFRAKAYAALGKPELALKDINQAKKLFPDDIRDLDELKHELLNSTGKH